jgi:hypothetical protein
MTFEEFAAARLGAVLRFAAVLAGERALAEDIVQEVLIRAHARWDQIGRLDRPESYVRKMIVNEYLSWRRRSWRLVPSGALADGAGGPGPAAERQVRGHGHADRVQLCQRRCGLRDADRVQRRHRGGRVPVLVLAGPAGGGAAAAEPHPVQRYITGQLGGEAERG